MATINTADDLIEVLRSDDRVRSAVRRELLTDELVALPDKVDKMVEAQTEMLKTQTTILENIGEIREEQQALRETTRPTATRASRTCSAFGATMLYPLRQMTPSGSPCLSPARRT